MSTNTTSLFQATSILAVILSGTAIYFTQQSPARTDPVSTAHRIEQRRTVGGSHLQPARCTDHAAI